MTQQHIDKGKKLAIISYITIIGTIIALFTNNEHKNPFTAFHVRQALGLWLTFFILGKVISTADNWPATIGFWIFFSVLFFYGFIGALSGKIQIVPLLGKWFQKWFANIGN